MVALGRRGDVDALALDIDDPPDGFWSALEGADVVYHLAGVNRPQHPDEFKSGNVDFTAEVCRRLKAVGARPVVVFASSIQAECDTPYGASKLAAESVLATWSRSGGGPAAVFRLPNVYGKWGKPDYNSVVATFCHNVARGLPIRIDDPDARLKLAHVADVVSALMEVLERPPHGVERRSVSPVAEIAVGELASRVQAFQAAQHTPDLPDLSEHFTRTLYSTYVSYLEPDALAFNLDTRADDRGDLAELVREVHAGQIFVSRTLPGITRGNHYHDTKTERFMVIEGCGLVRLRPLGSREVLEFPVSGRSLQAVIIPPGVVHSIENVGLTSMVTAFWAQEVFDPDCPDTFAEPVLRDEARP